MEAVTEQTPAHQTDGPILDAGQSSVNTSTILPSIRAQQQDLKIKLAHARSVADYHSIAKRAAELASELAKCMVAPAVTPKPAPPAVQPASQPTKPPSKPTLTQSKPVDKPVKRQVFSGSFTVVTISCLPSGWGSDRLKRYLEKLQLPCKSVTKADGATQAVVEFASPQLAQRATQVIPQQLVLERLLKIQPGAGNEAGESGPAGQKRKAEHVPHQEGESGPAAQKRKAEHVPRQEGEKRPKANKWKLRDQREARTDVRDAVCPQWNVPYWEQLRDKADEVSFQLERTVSEISNKLSVDQRPQWAKDRAGKRCAPLLGILRSPQLEGYRNKAEFTCGRDSEGKAAVGYQLGLFKEGYMHIASPEECRHTSRASMAYAAVVSEHLKSSQLPVWDKTEGRGFWRLVLVREGSGATFLPSQQGSTTLAQCVAPPFAELDPFKYLVDTTGDRVDNFPPGMALSEVVEGEPEAPWPKEVMVMLQVDPNSSPDKAVMDGELTALETAIRKKEEAEGWPRCVLAMQVHVGVSNSAPANAPILPFPSQKDTDSFKPVIHDTLCDLRFRISPTAFFQVNSPTACVLYRLAGLWAAVDSNTLLLDVCCGTGTIGLTLARSVRKVFGIDMVASAIEDARENARLNNITNCEFFAGRAEDELSHLMARHATSYQNIVAILDPPRPGLHKTVLRTLLLQPRIKTIVYVSCNPSTMADNVVSLCSPPRASDTAQWTPFVPVQAVACDLFPHTKHVETVMLLKRP